MRQTAIMLVLLCLAAAGCTVSEQNQSVATGQPTITERMVGPGDTDVGFWRQGVCDLYGAAIGIKAPPLAVARANLLQFGAKTAHKALKQILSESEATSKMRIFAAFALAYTSVDYERGREVLLRFLAATNPDADNDLMVEAQALNTSSGPNLPACGGEDVAILVWRLFEQTQDEVLLQRLDEARQWSDGALSEVLNSLQSRLHPEDEPTEGAPRNTRS